jgi:type VI secretion system protein ImpJ
MTSPLARPQWTIGQVLLPQHFKALENALTSDAAIRSSTAGLPATGLLRLEWNGPELDRGVLKIETLAVLLHDGLLVDVPGNAKLTGPLDLKLPGRAQVFAFAHVFSAEEPAKLEALEPAPKEVPRRYFQVRLSTEGSMSQSQGRICLGEFAAGDDGVFRLLKKMVPPLLRLDSTPYLVDELKQVRRQIAEFEAVLNQTAAAALSRGESLLAVQRTRIEARKLVALLDDSGGGVHHHPYVVFDALRTFALELCILDGSARPWEPPAYRHDDQRPGFDLIFKEISKKLRAPPPESPCVPFELENGRWVVEIPSDAVAAEELFIAVRKLRSVEPSFEDRPPPGITKRVEARRNPLEGVRIASPERLRHVREHVLRGVRTEYLEKPPFLHAFGADVDFYRIVASGIGERGPEWAHVEHERALAFFHEPRLDGYRFLLCWRPR